MSRTLRLHALLALTLLLPPATLRSEEADGSSCEELLQEAHAELAQASEAFTRLGAAGADNHELRLEAESTCENAMGRCDMALEYHEDECGAEAEELLTRATSLYFWIRRTAPLSYATWKERLSGKEGGYDLEEEYARITGEGTSETPEEVAPPEESPPTDEPGELAQPTTPVEPTPPGDEGQPAARPPTPEELACSRFDEAMALEEKDTFAAFLIYSELSAQSPTTACGRKALARIAEIMRPDSGAEQPPLRETISFLKKGLHDDDPAARIQAAHDMLGLKASLVVNPLIDTLRKEDDARVSRAILLTLRTTNRRRTCEELGDFRRFGDRDEQKQLDVIDCLADIGGPRGARAIGEFFRSRNPKVIDTCFARLKGIGIDGGVGLAPGLYHLLRSRRAAYINRCLDLMGELKHPDCASAIIGRGKGLLRSKGDYFNKALETLTAIGWNATWSLIDEGMASNDDHTKRWSQYVLKQKITGWPLAMGVQAWRDRWRQAVINGEYPLPHGFRSIP